MSRSHYVLLSALLSCAAGFAVAGFGDVLIPGDLPYAGVLAGFVASGTVAAWIAGSACGLAVFLLAGFFLPAIIDSAALGVLAERIRRAAAEPTPESFLSAFHHTLLEEGRSYAMGLWQNQTRAGASDPIWRSPREPEALFGPAQRTREAHGTLFAQISLAMLALGIGSAFWAERTDGPARPVSIGIAVIALTLWVGVRLLTYFRLQQTCDIISATRALFPPAGAEFVLDRVSMLIGADGAARALAIEGASHAVGAGIETAVGKAKDALATHDRRIAASVASAVERATQPIAASIQDLLERIEAESAAKSAQLLESILAEFLGAFQQRFGTQMAELGELLAGTRLLAQELRQSFTQSEAKLADDTAQLGRAMLDGVGEAVDRAISRQAEATHAVVHRFDESVAQIGAVMEKLAARSDAAMETWTGRTEEITRAVIARGVEELKRTASAFSQLHTILETLSITVLPAINKLVTTQERLQAAILSNHGNAQSVSAAASDLGEAARVAREMVERQILFTRELAQLAHSGSNIAAQLPQDEDLVRAIDTLRAETDDDRKSLPQL